MVLSDVTIQEQMESGRIVVNPLGEGCIQPASVDLRLDKRLLKFFPGAYSHLDVRQDLDALTQAADIPDPAPYILQSQEFILASTLEHIELPDDVVARLEGKSSLGRLGLLVHSTAGYVDPGWKGQLTLEISNVAQVPITLYYGMRISQISFLRLTTPAARPYGSSGLGSKYQGQSGPTAARLHDEFQGGPLMPGDNMKNGREARPYPDEPTPLKIWLKDSPFEGDLARFAQVLGSPVKTVEDWVYGRHVPAASNAVKLFELTRLDIYAPRTDAEQGALQLNEETQQSM